MFLVRTLADRIPVQYILLKHNYKSKDLEMSSMVKAWLPRSFYLTLCMSRTFLIRQNHRRQTLEEICESSSFLSFPKKVMRPAPSHTLSHTAGSLALLSVFTFAMAGLAWEDKSLSVPARIYLFSCPSFVFFFLFKL